MRRVIILFIAITAAWAGYRYFVIAPEWVDEFVAKPIILLFPILLFRNSHASLGMQRSNLIRHILLGVGLGAILLFESMLTRYMRFGSSSFTIPTFVQSLQALSISFATAMIEEIVYRGYFFGSIFSFTDNELIGNIVSSLFFTIAHLPLAIFSLHYTGGDLAAYCAQIFVLGAIFAYVFARVETIVPTTIAHTLWNFSNVFIR